MSLFYLQEAYKEESFEMLHYIYCKTITEALFILHSILSITMRWEIFSCLNISECISFMKLTYFYLLLTLNHVSIFALNVRKLRSKQPTSSNCSDIVALMLCIYITLSFVLFFYVYFYSALIDLAYFLFQPFCAL